MGFAPFRFKLIGKPLHSAVPVADLHKTLGKFTGKILHLRCKSGIDSVDIPEELNTILQQQVVKDEAYLKDYPLPEGTLVMIVERKGKYIVPNGKLFLKKNDKLLLISAKNDATEESEKTFSFLDRISKTRSKNN